MAWSGRRSGPHGSGAELHEFRGWRTFVHLARELKLARLARLAYPYRGRAALSIVAMVLVTLTGLAVPYLVKIAIDSGIQKRDLHVVDLVIVAFLVVNLLNLGASYVQTYLVSWVGERIILDLRRNVFAHLQKLSLDFFSRQRTGWIVSRLTNDIDALDQLVTDGVTSLITNGLTIVGAAVLLFVLSSRLALATLAIMPLLLIATLRFRTRSARSYALVRNRIGDVSAHLQESISGMRVLKAFRAEDRDMRNEVGVNAAYRDANMQTVVQSGLYFPFVELMSAVGIVIVLWYGGTLVVGGAIQVGVLVAFIGYLGSFFDPIQQLSQLYNTFQSSMAAVQKIYTVLDTEPDLTDAPDARPLRDVRGRVEFDHVTFGYGDADDVLHDVDFAVAPGATVALVGTTGAGKSTIIKLLARFYDPRGGAVRIDGLDLRKATTKSLREQLAVVPQEAFLFTGSILDNIRFGRPEASLEEVRAHRPHRRRSRLRRRAAGGVRHRRPGGRERPVDRAAPAHLVRPGAPGRSPRADPRRGDLERRRRERAAHLAGHGRALQRPHVGDRRAPPQHGALRRRDPGDRGGPHRRARQPRRARARRRPLLRPVPRVGGDGQAGVTRQTGVTAGPRRRRYVSERCGGRAAVQASIGSRPTAASPSRRAAAREPAPGGDSAPA